MRDQNAARAAEPQSVERAGMNLLVLRSCHSAWYFDPSRRRFQRVPSGVDALPQGDWIRYHRLEVEESGSFMVTLNDDDTRILRSWVHSEPCPHCHLGERTEELRLTPVQP